MSTKLAESEIVLDGARFKIVDSDIDELKSNRVGKLQSANSGKHYVIRLGGKRLQENVGTLLRATRHAKDLPPLVAHGTSPLLGHYAITKWVGGTSLDTGGGPLKPRTFAETCDVYAAFVGLASSLQRLHDVAGVVHADISAANVIRRNDGMLALIDFGLAFRVERTTRRDLEDKGTWKYRAPELTQEDIAVDFRADQFSASVLLYQMLTADLPYDGNGGDTKDVSIPAGLVGRKNKFVWPSLEYVVQKCLKLNRDERFPTSRQWVEALRAARPTQSVWQKLISPFALLQD